MQGLERIVLDQPFFAGPGENRVLAVGRHAIYHALELRSARVQELDRNARLEPVAPDQFVNAARVAELGLGQVVPNEAEPGTVGAAVERLLSDQDLLSQVQAVRDEIARMPHPSQVVQVLEARH